LTVTNEAGSARLNWNPRFGAIQYFVDLVVVYEEFDDYSGTSEIWDARTDAIGTTTGATLLDAAHAVTGDNRCFLYQSYYGSASYVYYYEIWATFLPYGAPGARMRYPALVAPTGAPCI
jgi:hypothetical protein